MGQVQPLISSPYFRCLMIHSHVKDTDARKFVFIALLCKLINDISLKCNDSRTKNGSKVKLSDLFENQ